MKDEIPKDFQFKVPTTGIYEENLAVNGETISHMYIEKDIEMKDEIDELNHIGDGRILVTKDELLSLKKKWETESYKNGYIDGGIDTLKSGSLDVGTIHIDDMVDIDPEIRKEIDDHFFELIDTNGDK